MMIILVIGGVVLGMSLMYLFKDTDQVKPFQCKAVELGYGRWVISRNGKTKFEWIIPESHINGENN